MERLIYSVLDHRKGVVCAFIALALICTCMIPFVRTNYNMVDYLPPGAQSTDAISLMTEEFDQAIPNAYVMVNDQSIADALLVKEDLAAIDGVENVMWLDDIQDIAVPLQTLDQDMAEQYYKDGNALFQVTIEEGYETQAVASIREYIDDIGEGNAVSGDAADSAQMQDSTVEQVVGACALLVPIIILLLVLSTMSWIEPVLFLAAIGVSILINMGTNIFLGSVSFITYSVSPILQLAVSLDYAIFLLHSFAAHRGDFPDTFEGTKKAMARAVRLSFSTILASAVTTLFGFGALVFMQFQIGADLGLNLVKGIVFSFVTVMVFLPALTLCMYKLIDKTTHRRLMPTFQNIGRPLAKVRIPALVVVAVLAVPAFLGQSHLTFTYTSSTPDPGIRTGADTLSIQEQFGKQNMMAVLVPRESVADELELSRNLEALDHVKGVMSYASTVGAQIPDEFLSESVAEQFYSDDWARIIAYLDTDVEGEAAFDAVEQVQKDTAELYDTYYAAGQSANLYDMMNIVDEDNVRVSILAIIAIFLVVAITFKSIGLPIALLLAIECGIWINLAIPYFMGTEINFIGYLVVNTVQLGATIDYAILLTTNYLRKRKSMPAKEAIRLALGQSFKSLVISAGILTGAGIALGVSSNLSAVCSLGFLLARGAVISLVMVTCFLPALLVYGDKLIRITTWKSGFMTRSKGSGSQPEGAISQAQVTVAQPKGAEE